MTEQEKQKVAPRNVIHLDWLLDWQTTVKKTTKLHFDFNIKVIYCLTIISIKHGYEIQKDNVYNVHDMYII